MASRRPLIADAGVLRELPAGDTLAGDVAALIVNIDGGGAAISTGVKGDVVAAFPFEILEWAALADQTGSIEIDIWKDTYANYPPTSGDSITASARPAIASGVKGQSSTLTGWTTSVALGDTLRFNVASASGVQRVTLVLKVRRT